MKDQMLCFLFDIHDSPWYGVLCIVFTFFFLSFFLSFFWCVVSTFE